MKPNLRSLAASVALAAGLVAVSAANAALQVKTISGNDCSGVFGKGFEECEVGNSPIIIKFDVEGDIEVNSIFPSIDGSEFTFTPALDDDLSAGTWTYTRNDATDPLIRYWVAKGGPSFNLFWEGTSDPNSAIVQFSNQWYTPDQKGISHISFYDTFRRVPEPGTLGLLGLTLAGLAFASRRRRAA